MSKKAIVLTFFTWRFLLFIPLIFSPILLRYHSGYEYTNIWYFVKSYFPVNSSLLYPWANFDGVHYLAIAGEGYTNNARFFPFYPVVIHTVTSFFGNFIPFSAPYFIVALILSSLFFLMALFVLYKLLLLDVSKKIATTAIIFLILFPTSFFFVSIYSESLFLLLTVLSFYFARKKKWWLASIFAALSSLTRVVGIATIFAVITEFIIEEKIFQKFKSKGISIRLITKLIPLFILPTGFLAYGIYNLFRWNDFLHFWKAQGDLANGRSVTSIIFFPQTIYRYLKILFTVPIRQYEWSTAFLELVSFIFAAILIYLMWKKRMRLSYLIYSIVGLSVPALSGTFTGLPRYVIILFPLFIVSASIKSSLIKIIYIVLCVILLPLLLILFSRGYFIA